MKTAFLTIAFTALVMFGFSTKASAQVDFINDLPCAVSITVNYASPCSGWDQLTVPPGPNTLRTIGSAPCKAASYVIDDGVNPPCIFYVGTIRTGTCYLCGAMRNINFDADHVGVHL